MAKRQLSADPTDGAVFFLRKEDKIELTALHFATQGAKSVAQIAINETQRIEKQFNDKLVSIRADLGIVEKENLAIDLDAGTITVKREPS